MPNTWFGSFSLPVGSAAFLQAGPFQLWLLRSQREWRAASIREGDSMNPTLVVEVPSTRTDPPEGSTLLRIGYQQSPNEVHLLPLLMALALLNRDRLMRLAGRRR